MIIGTLLSFGQSLIPPTVHLPHDVAINIVKSTSGMLPQADSIAHYILSTNKVIIDNLLDNDKIAMEYKKPIILFLIEFAQKGDHTGSHILSMYYDIVNHVL
tara:strand:- start:8181 stop:8486 length:306 start_codon:yes stop_codon:yes gene_type:complete